MFTFSDWSGQRFTRKGDQFYRSGMSITHFLPRLCERLMSWSVTTMVSHLPVEKEIVNGVRSRS